MHHHRFLTNAFKTARREMLKLPLISLPSVIKRKIKISDKEEKVPEIKEYWFNYICTLMSEQIHFWCYIVFAIFTEPTAVAMETGNHYPSLERSAHTLHSQVEYQCLQFCSFQCPGAAKCDPNVWQRNWMCKFITLQMWACCQICSPSATGISRLMVSSLW